VGVLFEGRLLVDQPRGRVDIATLGRMMAGDGSVGHAGPPTGQRVTA
jgi:hypothetical protein